MKKLTTSSKFPSRSVGGSGAKSEHITGSVVCCKLERDLTETPAQLEDVYSSSTQSNDSEDLESERNQGLSPEHQYSYSGSMSEEKQKNFGTPGNTDCTKVIGSEQLRCSSIYYDQPKFDIHARSGSDHLNMPHTDFKRSPSISPARFHSPLGEKGNISFMKSPECILKGAARSFPNTPSIFRKRWTAIFRKRRTETLLLFSSGKCDSAVGETTSECSPNEGKKPKCTSVGKGESGDELSYVSTPQKSSSYDGESGRKSLDTSNRCSTILKSVEKRLGLTFAALAVKEKSLCFRGQLAA